MVNIANFCFGADFQVKPRLPGFCGIACGKSILIVAQKRVKVQEGGENIRFLNIKEEKRIGMGNFLFYGEARCNGRGGTGEG